MIEVESTIRHPLIYILFNDKHTRWKGYDSFVHVIQAGTNKIPQYPVLFLANIHGKWPGTHKILLWRTVAWRQLIGNL